MGCCTSKDEDLPPPFNPIIGLSDKMLAEGVTREGLTISGTGSIMGDSPILQDKAYFEVTVVRPGTFAVGVATKDVALDGVLSQDKVCTLSCTPTLSTPSAMEASNHALVRS